MARTPREADSARWLDTADGLRLAVWEHGDPSAPTVLAVHGYPDDHGVWDGVVTALAAKYHVVTYDVRGAGESDQPQPVEAYRLDRLTDDLGRVIDAVSPHRPVHLLAHDWGSVQAWHAVTEPRSTERFASFTSISGPCLDHVGRWMRAKLRRPTPRALRELITQLICSGYIGFFQLPVLPELVWRTGLLPKLITRLERFDPHSAANPARPALSDGLHGLQLYRANMGARMTKPGERRTDLPVQVLAPNGDPFVSAPLQTEIAPWVPNLRVRSLPGGHWLPRARPELVARCTSELIEHVEGGPESRALRRSRVRPGRHFFQDHLVVITGAGSGIGQATALAFAAQGAHVVAADIDGSAAERTAEQIARTGAGATPYRVDVADQAGMARFAEHVHAELGTPDVVVNNAGIGIAGSFVDTAVADWERAIDINLWGVIHGCRLFAAQMIERGEGGRIVNVASAAAYLPSRVLPAYSTTKAAVLALSECLRIELAAEGIRVTAVCPGLVNTGITTSTRFVGVTDAEQDRRRGAAERLYQRRNFTPQRAAAEILRAVRRDVAVAPITAEARVGLVLSRLTPGLLRAAARADLTPR
ncbi:SDR family oxidoreductase [Saccharopolyspora sp. 5N708]|uniref:SDR family oxidoreductase n=1 Tax=Saccharopolyspora sp. 5N708 TaxID=3457424 RepID=UPI003FD27164